MVSSEGTAPARVELKCLNVTEHFMRNHSGFLHCTCNWAGNVTICPLFLHHSLTPEYWRIIKRLDFAFWLFCVCISLCMQKKNGRSLIQHVTEEGTPSCDLILCQIDFRLT